MIISIFIGTNGSMGFESGQTYQLITALRNVGSNQVISVKDAENANRWCPYNSVEDFLRNWHIVAIREK